MLEPLRRRLARWAVALAGASAIAVTGCGGGDDAKPAPKPPPAATIVVSTIPHSLRVVESGAEDTTDFILSGHRAQAIKSVTALDRAVRGDAATNLEARGVPRATLVDLERRAAALRKIVAGGRLLDVALAANHVFELVPGLFGLYDDPVPAAVTRLDYLDFEAKLRALAGDRPQAAKVIGELQRTWDGLRTSVVAAGGKQAAGRFDAHVERMLDLRDGAAGRDLAREAQHGLDLVDEIEEV